MFLGGPTGHAICLGPSGMSPSEISGFRDNAVKSLEPSGTNHGS